MSYFDWLKLVEKCDIRFLQKVLLKLTLEAFSIKNMFRTYNFTDTHFVKLWTC